MKTACAKDRPANGRLVQARRRAGPAIINLITLSRMARRKAWVLRESVTSADASNGS